MVTTTTALSRQVQTIRPRRMGRMVRNLMDGSDFTSIYGDGLLSRVQQMQNLLDGNRDIDRECGYPTTISREQYRLMYDREGVGRRVVQIFPEESWKIDPEIYENEDSEPDDKGTPFEIAWEALNKKRHVLAYLQRADTMSGIGHFGIVLLGVDDGKDLSEPIDGIDLSTGEASKTTGTKAKRELLFMRTFDESMVYISAWETDPQSPRYGEPLLYLVQFMDWRTVEMPIGVGIDNTMRQVHWTRVLHVADNRESSEVFGVPRMKPVYNRLLDIRKVGGGSGEMFWRGAFPGFSFEVNPDLLDAEIDQEAMKQQFAAYSNGLQRYLALTGVSAKSLAPQVADPSGHLDAQLRLVSLTIGVPWRIFLGSEEAKLASAEDTEHWHDRLRTRQTKYMTPFLIRPAIDRFIAIGILPAPAEGEFIVNWPDLSSPSDADKAQNANMTTDTLQKYVQGGVSEFIPELEFMIYVLGFDAETAEAIMDANEKRLKEMEDM